MFDNVEFMLKFKHELPKEFLQFLDHQKITSIHFEKICNKKAEENPSRCIEYHMSRNQSNFRQEGIDYILQLMGYEWSAKENRYLMAQ